MGENVKSHTLFPEAPEPIPVTVPKNTSLERVRKLMYGLAAGVLIGLLPHDAGAEDLPESRTATVPSVPMRKFVIGGGGFLPDSIHRKFVEMAGGPDAKVVVIPTASAAADEDLNVDSYWKWGQYVRTAKILHTRDPEVADSEDFADQLKDATAVWFSGGAQSDLVKPYLNKRLHKELQKLSDRGGVIGGSSAGASALSKLMIERGSPKAELGTGFGVVPFAVIDQHHDRDGRLERLLGVTKLHPQYLGMGIKPKTAVILHWTAAKVTATVMGEGDVRFCRDQNEPKVLKDGETINLDDLRMVIPFDQNVESVLQK